MAGRKARKGSGFGMAVESYGNPRVIAEAKQRKRGGRTLAQVESEEHKIIGDMAKKRMDKRARGGRTNATSSPFSSAGGGSASKNPFSSARGR